MSSNISNALTAIDDEIALLEERLGQLRTSRKVLALEDAEIAKALKARAKKAATEDDDDDEDEAPAPKSSKGSSRRRTRREASSDDDEDEAPAPAKRAKRKSASAKGDVSGESKADRIRAMLADGDAPKDIAEALDVNIRYVYGVRRGNK